MGPGFGRRDTGAAPGEDCIASAPCYARRGREGPSLTAPSWGASMPRLINTQTIRAIALSTATRDPHRRLSSLRINPSPRFRP